MMMMMMICAIFNLFADCMLFRLTKKRMRPSGSGSEIWPRTQKSSAYGNPLCFE